MYSGQVWEQGRSDGGRDARLIYRHREGVVYTDTGRGSYILGNDYTVRTLGRGRGVGGQHT